MNTFGNIVYVLELSNGTLGIFGGLNAFASNHGNILVVKFSMTYLVMKTETAEVVLITLDHKIFINILCDTGLQRKLILRRAIIHYDTK